MHGIRKNSALGGILAVTCILALTACWEQESTTRESAGQRTQVAAPPVTDAAPGPDIPEPVTPEGLSYGENPLDLRDPDTYGRNLSHIPAIPDFSVDDSPDDVSSDDPGNAPDDESVTDHSGKL